MYLCQDDGQSISMHTTIQDLTVTYQKLTLLKTVKQASVPRHLLFHHAAMAEDNIPVLSFQFKERWQFSLPICQSDKTCKEGVNPLA
jgi:hypothetical protein